MGKAKLRQNSGWVYAGMMAGLISLGAITISATVGIPSRLGADDQAPSPHPSAIVTGLALPAPFVYQETLHDQGIFSALEIYTVSPEALSPLEAGDRVLSDILALGFSNAGEARETEDGSEDHMNSLQLYLSGQGKHVQLLVGWAEPAFEEWEPNIYVMIGEYRPAAA